MPRQSDHGAGPGRPDNQLTYDGLGIWLPGEPQHGYDEILLSGGNLATSQEARGATAQ